MVKNIVFAGATSGTGLRVFSRLAKKFGNENILCIVRATSNTELLRQMGANLEVADITIPDSYKRLLNPKSVFLDMTHPKYYHKSLETVVQSGVKRAYFVTTTGIYSKFNHLSKIYIENEAKIINSGITYTILRPSMIYGNPMDKNMSKLIRFLKNYPVFPIFGSGESLMQPVFADDLADGIVSAIGNRKTENKAYNLAGPSEITYNQIIQEIIKGLNRHIITIRVPFSFALNIIRLLEKIHGFPITHEQVLRLQEDKVFDITASVLDLDFSPRAFQEGIRTEIDEIYPNWKSKREK
jgi:nucleoside-diphosphate-sugar epimerase